MMLRLSENAHLPFDRLTALSKVEGPFDKLMALSKVEGLRYPHPLSLRRTSLYASFLGISEALHLDTFHQPLGNRVFRSPVLLLFRCVIFEISEGVSLMIRAVFVPQICP